MGSAPWEIDGVHIVVVVNNIHTQCQTIPFKSTLTHEFNVWFLDGRLD